MVCSLVEVLRSTIRPLWRSRSLHPARESPPIRFRGVPGITRGQALCFATPWSDSYPPPDSWLRFLPRGSWKPTTTAVANPPDKTWKTEDSEGRHAGRSREKDAARPIAEASDQVATNDGYGRRGQGPP